MDDLRSEIRAAFEMEQAAHPPLGGLRITLTAAAATQPRPARNLRWIVVAVAALLVIAVVAGLVWTRDGPRADVPGANPGALKDYGPPPAGVPLFYLIDPRNTKWLQAYDWQGEPRGTIKFAKPVNPETSIIPAPDGSGFIYQPPGEGGEFLDRLGRPIAPGLGSPVRPIAPGFGSPVAPYGAWMWADDSRHLCVTRDAPSGDWGLFTKLPGEADHLVGIIPPPSNGGDPSSSLVSCSFRNDRAMVIRPAGAPPSELVVYRISDGKVLSDYKYSNPGQIKMVVASRDGLLIAEVPRGSTAQPPAGAPSTIIRRVSDRSVVATLDPSVEILPWWSFSGDDSRVLAYRTTPVPRPYMGVIDLRSGRVTWHEQDILPGSWWPNPDGPDFVISSNVSGPTETHGALGAFEIIHGDGSVTRIPGSYTPAPWVDR